MRVGLQEEEVRIVSPSKNGRGASANGAAATTEKEAKKKNKEESPKPPAPSILATLFKVPSELGMRWII